MARASKDPPELRERAVRMVQESGRPIRRVAADLGIQHEALGLWVRRAEAGAVPAQQRVPAHRGRAGAAGATQAQR